MNSDRHIQFSLSSVPNNDSAEIKVDHRILINEHQHENKHGQEISLELLKAEIKYLILLEQLLDNEYTARVYLDEMCLRRPLSIMLGIAAGGFIIGGIIFDSLGSETNAIVGFSMGAFCLLSCIAAHYFCKRRQERLEQIPSGILPGVIVAYQGSARLMNIEGFDRLDILGGLDKAFYATRAMLRKKQSTLDNLQTRSKQEKTAFLALNVFNENKDNTISKIVGEYLDYAPSAN